MPVRDDMTSFLQQPTSPFDQRVVSKFMKISPKVLGTLGISVGIAMFILTIWTGFYYLLWSCLISVLIGSVTVSAAFTPNICRVRISQFLNCFNAVAAAISIPFHCVDSDGVTLIILLLCDVLIFFISVIVASSACDCCNTKSRHDAVRDVPYMTDANIVLRHQLGPFAPPPNYDPSPSAPPQIYDPSPPAAPPIYDLYPSVPPTNCNPSPSVPPPNYDEVAFEAPQVPGLFEPPPSYDSCPSAPPLNDDPDNQIINEYQFF